MFLRCFCLSLVSFGVRVLLSHSVCSDKAANTCQGAHENAKLLMAIATKNAGEKKRGCYAIIYKKKKKKRKFNNNPCHLGFASLLGLCFHL